MGGASPVPRPGLSIPPLVGAVLSQWPACFLVCGAGGEAVRESLEESAVFRET